MVNNMFRWFDQSRIIEDEHRIRLEVTPPATAELHEYMASAS
jgi:hypothetical protein